MPRRHNWKHRSMNSQDTSSGSSQHKTAATATATATAEEARTAHLVEIQKLREQILEHVACIEAIDDAEDGLHGLVLDRKSRVQYGNPLTSDADVICSDSAREQYKAFLNRHGGSYLGKTVRLIDFLLANAGVEATQAAYSEGTIEEASAMAIETRDQGFDEKNCPAASWDMLLELLKENAVKVNCEEEMETLMQSPGGVVPRDLWDQVWKQFSTIPSPTAFDTTSHRMIREMTRFLAIMELEELDVPGIPTAPAMLRQIIKWMNYSLEG
ncbi:hypothetical protein V492_07429 [Pseudogymnoascus sp. VKM F-4246]|nr:hypothetical protein V492_07429 [Pseudogymnoascus sp. VKM F-4246]